MIRRLFVALCLTLCTAVAIAAPTGDLPEFTPDASVDRASIPGVYRWNLEDLYPSDADWSKSFASAQAELAGLADLHPGLSEPAKLAAYLSNYFRLEVEINRLTLYANLQRVAEMTNQDFIARHQSALALTNAIMEEGSVMRHAILALSGDELEAAFIEAPALGEYRPAIDRLRRRASRVLDPDTERVLSLAGDNLWAAIDLNELPSAVELAFQAVVSEMKLPNITDEQGNEVEMSFANYGVFRSSSDRRVRRDAVAKMFESLKGFENTFAATLGGQAQFDVFLARARNYDTALEAYLDKDALDPAVYHTLIETVRAHAPALHRYVELRKKVMGIDEVHLYDLYIPLAQGVERELNYAEGARTIVEALAPLGLEYVGLAAKMSDPASGGIDVYPSNDKESGAFSSSVFGVHPFIKMNYQNRYDDVSTLAHELGHAVHSHLSNTRQPYLSSRYAPFLAEIASTCNEMLLSSHMVENAASDAERAWLLSELVETMRTTIYRQTLFAEFELKLHELVEAGEPVTADRLNSIYTGLIRDYYGPGYSIDENDGIEWAYIPHFYYKYYVFNYATGLVSGIALVERMSSGVPGAVDDFLGMLGGGNSKPPLELLREAGVDLTTPDPIDAALELFDRTLSQLEELLLDDS